MIALLSILGIALAIDVNDELELRLAGGETVQGWFVRYDPEFISMHAPSLGQTIKVPLSVVEIAHMNGDAIELSILDGQLQEWHLEWRTMAANPSPAPLPGVVVLTSVALAGSGHALLGDWEYAPGMMVADAFGMGLIGWEMGHQQRLNVVSGALALSLVMKLYAATNGSRKARRARAKRIQNTGR